MFQNCLALRALFEGTVNERAPTFGGAASLRTVIEMTLLCLE